MKKTFLFIGAGIVVVILLAGGTFTAMRLFNAKAQGANGGIFGLLQPPGGSGNQRVQVIGRLIPAPEVPTETPDLSGLVVSIKDNSIFVSQRDHFNVSVSNGMVQQQPTPQGPYIEVVVSKGTKLYRDVTFDSVAPPKGSSSSSPTQFQQKVEPGDVSDISSRTSTFLQVWGLQRGSRLNADVIVFQTP